jgi:pentatricopeptide repeat protein
MSTDRRPTAFDRQAANLWVFKLSGIKRTFAHHTLQGSFGHGSLRNWTGKRAIKKGASAMDRQPLDTSTSACDKGRKLEWAFEAFDAMKEAGVPPNLGTFAALLSVCEKVLPPPVVVVCRSPLLLSLPLPLQLPLLLSLPLSLSLWLLVVCKTYHQHYSESMQGLHRSG